MRNLRYTGDLSLRQLDDVFGSSRYVDDVPQRRLAASCANSFTAGTLVQTEDGLVPIEDIAVGDKVVGEDPDTANRAPLKW